MKKTAFIFLLTTFTLAVNAQSKKKKKQIEKASTEVIVAEKDSITTKNEETLPLVSVSEETKETMKYTKVIPIGTNVFVQMVFNSVVQVVRSGAPDMALVKNEENVVTIQALTENVNSNISIKTAD